MFVLAVTTYGIVRIFKIETGIKATAFYGSSRDITELPVIEDYEIKSLVCHISFAVCYSTDLTG